jgi:hypothetical protein
VAAVPKIVEVNEAALQLVYFGELDARLAAEGRDAVWSAATEERLRTSAHELRPRISLAGAQCGQTLCRAEIAVADLREEAAALDKFISTSTALLPEAVVRDGEQPGGHIVYFARRVGDFPPMNAAETASP